MKWTKKFAVAALAAAMALTVAGCGGGDKKADQKVTLKMATALPSSHPLVKAMDTLKAKANEKSKGSVTIQI